MKNDAIQLAISKMSKKQLAEIFPHRTKKLRSQKVLAWKKPNHHLCKQQKSKSNLQPR